MKTRVAIAVAGALGMLIILKTSAYYASMDRLAFSLTLTMGVALAAGLWELWTLAGHTESLRNELGGLPKDVDDAQLDRVSPMLRALLRARLDRTALPVPGPVFAPYIIGLLVMLGLLGTFMGLFETLRGASTALTTSTDVEALRAGLQQPMQGLMRSFGTSATGVAASAMLGLASVFVRRAAGRLGVLLHEVASGPLARYSPAHRQLVALEALSAQGKALPEAAQALREAGQRIDALREHFSKTLDAGESRRSEQHEKATARVVAEVERARKELDALGGRNEKAIEKLTSQWDKSHTQVAKELSSVSGRNEKALEKLTGHWEKAHARVAQETSETLKQTLSQVSASIDSGVIQAAERASETLSPLLAQAVEKTVDAATSHLDAVLGAVQEDATARRQAQSAATDALEQRVTALLSALGTLEAERRRADQEQLARFESQTGALLSERSAADEALLTRLSDHLAAYQGSRAEADAAALSRLDAHAGTIVETLEANRHSQAERLVSQEQALVTHQQKALDALAAQRSATQAEHAALLAQLALQAGNAQQAEEARNRELFAAVDATLDHLQAFSKDTTEREQLRATEAMALSERVTQDMAGAAQLVRERLLRSEEAERTQQDRSQALFEKLESAAETIGKAAESQVGALAEFVQTTEARMREAESSAQARMQEFLHNIQVSTETQQERLLAFERALEEARQQGEAATVTRAGQTLSRIADFEATLREAARQSEAATEARVEQTLARITDFEATLRDARQQSEQAAQARAEETLARITEFGAQLEGHSTRSAASLTEQVAALGAGLLGAEERLLDKHASLSELLQAQAKDQSERFAHVQDTLLSQQQKRSEELSTLFATQLQTLESKVSESTGLINEAAQLVKGGGAELVTVAETFGAAVEQQRTATQQWLESLGDIERTVTDAGEAAAADVLGQHLARTHEVFDRQLRFQQELIEQLRNPPKRDMPQDQVSDATA